MAMCRTRTKSTSRLTLNLGLRYDLPFPYTEIKNRQTLWIPGRQSTVVPTAPAGLLYPGDQGVPAGLIPTFQESLCSARGRGVGSHRKREMAGDFRLWNLLRALLHGPGRAAAIADQCAALSADRADQPWSQHASQFLPIPTMGPPPPAGTFATPLTNLTLAPNLPLPYTQDWDLNVQRSLGQNLLLEIGYVGTKGTKLPRFIEGNPAVYIPGSTSGNPISTTTTRTSGAFILDARWLNRPAPASIPRPA